MDDYRHESSVPRTVVSSHSGLTTHLSTPATASETLAAASATLASHPDTSALGFKSEVLSQLGIPTHLADRTDQGLYVAYEKYKAYLEACQVYERQLADGSWIGSKLTAMDLIQLFVSKSFWHSHYKPLFSKVLDYPDMVKWLEGVEDRLTNDALWGYEKSSYHFKDLKAYLGEREREREVGGWLQKKEGRWSKNASKIDN